jgi:DNA-binding transcriptional ArsR family regulator
MNHDYGPVAGAADPAQLAQALGHPLRLSAAKLLADRGPMSFTALREVLDVQPGLLGNHLAQLLTADVLVVQRRGRTRWYRLPDARVAEVVENLYTATGTVVGADDAPRDTALARRCTDHVGGRLGVELAGRLLADGVVVQDGDTYAMGVGVPSSPILAHVMDAGGDVPSGRRAAVTGCPDTTEGRDHLGGLLGARLAAGLHRAGWVEDVPGSRALSITASGWEGLHTLGVMA